MVSKCNQKCIWFNYLHSLVHVEFLNLEQLIARLMVK
jgi:hypothetical protein